jgi:hypothetical protein
VLQDVLVLAAGEVGRGVDDEAVKEAGVVVDELLDRVDGGAEDLGRVLQAFAGTGGLTKSRGGIKSRVRGLSYGLGRGSEW